MLRLVSKRFGKVVARKGAIAVVFLALAVFFSGCAGTGSDGGKKSPETDSEPIRVGLLAPFSGPFAQAGKTMTDSLSLAVIRVNEAGGIKGRLIEIVPADSQGKADQARTQALQLLERERAWALIGAYLSEETLEVMEVAADKRVPLIIPVSASNEINAKIEADPQRYRYVFRVAYNITQWAQMMGDYILSTGVTGYAFIGANIRWNKEFAATLEDYLAPHQVDLVYQEFYSAQQPVFEPLLQNLESMNPPILVLGDPGQNSVQFAKRIRQADLQFPIFSVGGALGDTRAASTIDPQGDLFFQAAAWSDGGDRQKDFFERFKAISGYAPMGYADVLSHDALTVLAEAITRSGNLDPDAVAAQLESGSFTALGGHYRFGEGHQALWKAGSELGGRVVKWDGDKGQTVWPR